MRQAATLRAAALAAAAVGVASRWQFTIDGHALWLLCKCRRYRPAKPPTLTRTFRTALLDGPLTRQAGMNNGLARTPPMGWSSWNAYGGHQSEEVMREAADLLASLGLAELGYVHVDMDGGWFNFNGHLNASGYPATPWDMRGLADHVHGKGLKLGMYVTGGFSAVYMHEEAWAEVMFGEWGADSVKVDHMCSVDLGPVKGCRTAPGAINHPSDQIVPAFQQATVQRWASAIARINKTNSVLFNNCGIGCSPSEGTASRDPRPWGEWCRDLCNTWRTSGDINVVSWHSNLASLIGRGALSHPGGWNYPDSLEVGNGKHGNIMPTTEARAHFSLWCVTSSPLYLGMRLPNITASDLAIVSNKDAIAVNQAWAGFAGDMLNASQHAPANATASNYSTLPANSVWWKPLPNRSAAVVMYASRGVANVSFRFDELVHNGVAALPVTAGCRVRSVWHNGTEFGPVDGGFAAEVPANDVVFVVVHSCGGSRAR